MYKICQTEQSTRRQRELEKGLLELMGKRRFEDITVSDLCQHMNIPRKSFYRYFSSKDGALYALIDHTLADFFELPQAERGGKQGTALGDLDLYFLYWYRQKPLLDALHRNALSGILVERANEFAIHEGHFPLYMKSWDEKIQSIALSFSICGLMSMVFQWHRQNYPVPPQEMAKLATTLLTQPLIKF